MVSNASKNLNIREKRRWMAGRIMRADGQMPPHIKGADIVPDPEGNRAARRKHKRMKGGGNG